MRYARSLRVGLCFCLSAASTVWFGSRRWCNDSTMLYAVTVGQICEIGHTSDKGCPEFFRLHVRTSTCLCPSKTLSVRGLCSYGTHRLIHWHSGQPSFSVILFQSTYLPVSVCLSIYLSSLSADFRYCKVPGLQVYVINFSVHHVGVTNMFPLYNLSPTVKICCEHWHRRSYNASQKDY